MPAGFFGILASESAKTGFTDLKQRQTTAWEKQIEVLNSACEALVREIPTSGAWGLLVEYPIPRRQKRVDAVLLAADLIFCVEFKTEDKSHIKQTQNHRRLCLDLRDFHEESRGRQIIPIAVALKAERVEPAACSATDDLVRPVALANASDLAQIIALIFKTERHPASLTINAADWDYSSYRPVPTIVEAAEALYAGHDVREIAHSYAG